MHNVLFVDRERSELDDLRSALRADQTGVATHFVVGAQHALEALEHHDCAVIVSELDIPGMDGAELLQQVKRRHPSVVRILLAGKLDDEQRLRTLPVAHQCLFKPYVTMAVREAIERACGLQQILADPVLRNAVGDIGSLPVLPRLLQDIARAMQDPHTAVGEVARVLEQDVAMSAKVLQVVNSAFFGLARQINSVRHAVVYLGLDTVNTLVMSLEVVRTFESERQTKGFSLDTLQSHSLLTASIASRVVDDRELSREAFCAGMLHDVGKLIMSTRLPLYHEAVVSEAVNGRRRIHHVERDVYGCSHAETGAYLLGLWGLPMPIVEAVAHHHEPVRVVEPRLDLVAATHIADWLANGCDVPVPAVDPTLFTIDEAYLLELGVIERVADWQQMAAEIVKGS